MSAFVIKDNILYKEQSRCKEKIEVGQYDLTWERKKNKSRYSNINNGFEFSLTLIR